MNLTELRKTMEPEDIKRILYEYGVSPALETESYLVYPTVCHNIEGGSHKLYYYFDSKMFVCYTECNDSFNIFELIQKIEKLHGYTLNIFEVAEKMGYGTSPQRLRTEEEIREEKELLFLKQLSSKTEAPLLKYDSLDESVLSNFSTDKKYLSLWLNEGINEETLNRFKIGYSVKDEAISIPHRDAEGNLIGVRGRFVGPNPLNKYMPLTLSGKLLNHATRGNLYGLYENKENIERLRRVVIFEGEKSVLKMNSIYGSDGNTAVATSGNKVTNEQIRLFTELNVEEVVLAFDKDFKTELEREEILKRYESIAKRLSIYFNTSIIVDWINATDYKDSPIDKGKEVFEELFAARYFI